MKKAKAKSLIADLERQLEDAHQARRESTAAKRQEREAREAAYIAAGLIPIEVLRRHFPVGGMSRSDSSGGPTIYQPEFLVYAAPDPSFILAMKALTQGDPSPFAFAA